MFHLFVAGSTVFSPSHGSGDNVRSIDHRKTSVMKVYDNKADFLAELGNFKMSHVEEKFDHILGKQDSVDLKPGKNDVGKFKIIIDTPGSSKNVTDVGTIQSVDGGTYEGVVQTGITSVSFDYFENATIYAFGCSWDIDQEYDPLNPNNALHIRLGSGYNAYVLNLEEYMYLYDTRFIGFVDDFEGYRSMEIYSPEAVTPISFSMTEVIMSSSEPNPDRGDQEAMVGAQIVAQLLMNIFSLGGFFGEQGFWSEVVCGTWNFFFGGDDGLYPRITGGDSVGATVVSRYVGSMIGKAVGGD